METKKQILLVDDDTHISRSISDFLRARKYDVQVVASAEEALSALKTHLPDVIILDIMMPGIGGLGFLREVKRKEDGTPVVPIIVLSARASMADFFDESQVSAFLSKPCKGSDLLAEIEKCLSETGDTDNEKSSVPSLSSVLLAENDMDFTREVQSGLEKTGCTVHVAESAYRAIDMAPTLKPDIILVNEILEGMKGSALVPLLNAMPSTRSTPILLYDRSFALKEQQLRQPEVFLSVSKCLSPADAHMVIKHATRILRGEKE